MATGTVAQDRRTVRAAGIVSRQEVIPCDDRPGYFNVRDTGTGSGRMYLASATSCTCPDHVYRGHTCKHQIAAAREDQALRQYAADWDTRAKAQRPAGLRCPDCGSHLECQSYYVGGRGHVAFLVCRRDAQHKALPA